MATPEARVKAIFDALLNRSAPPALIQRGVNGVLGVQAGMRIAGPASEPLTNTQKAEAFLKLLGHYVKDSVRRVEERDAVTAASSTVASKVDTDFNEAP